MDFGRVAGVGLRDGDGGRMRWPWKRHNEFVEDHSVMTLCTNCNFIIDIRPGRMPNKTQYTLCRHCVAVKNGMKPRENWELGIQ